MAVRKKSTKTSKRAESSISLSDIEVSSKTKRSAKSTLKNAGAKTLFIVALFLVLGVAVGLGAWWFVCKDDCFQLIGNDEIVLTLDEKYVDEGVKIVAFGKDESSNVVIETNLEVDENGNFYSDEVGTFYITYKSECFKYGTLFKVQKVRLITFVEISEGGE